MLDYVFWRTGSKYIYSYATLQDGVYYCGNRTLEELRITEPEMQLISEAEYFEKVYALVKTNVSEITKERYFDMLEILPPVAWGSSGGVESFKMSERLIGNITDIYAKKRIGLTDRYFTFIDKITLPHTEIRDRVNQFIQALE